MSVDTKGYVKSSCVDVFLVRAKLEKVLAKYATPESNFFKYGPIYYELKHSCIFAIFNNGEDHRQLYIGFETKDLQKWIVFSLGDWGNSRQIMKDILLEFKDLGEAFIHECDCVGEPVKYLTN